MINPFSLSLITLKASALSLSLAFGNIYIFLLVYLSTASQNIFSGLGRYLTTASSKGYIPLFFNALPQNNATVE